MSLPHWLLLIIALPRFSAEQLQPCSCIIYAMEKHEQAVAEEHSSNLMTWFWIGGAMGIIFSAAAVIFATEFARKRHGLPAGEYQQSELDLVEDLSQAVTDGMDILSAAMQTATNFGTASRERIRYGLDPGDAGAGASGWYTGDEDD